MEDFDNRFDLEIRSLMENGQEEVPSRVWEGVSSALDRRKAPAPAAVWWRRAGIAVAAVAAASAAVLLINRTNTPEIPVPQVVATVDTPVKAAPVHDDIPTIEEQIVSRHSLLADIPEIQPSVTAPSGENESSPASQEIAQKEDTPQETIDNKEDTTPTKGAKVPLSFNKALFDKSYRPPIAGRFSISAGGNLQSNGSPAKVLSGMRFSPSRAPIKTGITEVGESTYGMTLSAGIGVRYNFTPKWSIGTGVTYSMLSRNLTATYREDTSPDISVTAKTDNFQHYIGIPLNVYYNVISRNAVKFYIWGGGAVEKGLVNKFVVHDASRDIHHKEKISGVQWSAGGGLGVEFAVAPNLGIYLDPGWRYYFDCSQPKSIRTQQPFTMNFEIGLRAGF